jgi:hypothetical protein
MTMIERDRSLVFFADPPKVTFTKTEPHGSSAVVVSGTVSFPIRQGRNQFATLDFPFAKAQGETAAIQQAVPQLAAVVDALENLVRELGGR